MPPFTISDAFMIPLEEGQAVSAGWTAATDDRPVAITWHWTATWDLATCSSLLGGANAARKGVASAHYGIGRSFAEGVDRYISLENRSWHAGKNQLLRWDGRPLESQAFKGARTSVGIETVNIGYARSGIPSQEGWYLAASPRGTWQMRIQPWTDDQVVMMIAVGKEILERWPDIRPRDHHGHHDLCPTYKVDVAAFPFAEVLRGIYDDPSIPDVWSPLWAVRGRQRTLVTLGYDLGTAGADGIWGDRSDAALRRLQRDHGLVEDGQWTTPVNWRVHELLDARGLELEQAAAGSAAGGGMVRVTAYLRPAHKRALDRAVGERNVSASRIVREALDAHLDVEA